MNAKGKALSKIISGKELKAHHEKAFKEGKTSLDWKQSRSLMRHVNKPN